MHFSIEETMKEMNPGTVQNELILDSPRIHLFHCSEEKE
jgi:hypothetical protein